MSFKNSARKFFSIIFVILNTKEFALSFNFKTGRQSKTICRINFVATIHLSNIWHFFLQTRAFSTIKHNKVDSTVLLVIFNAMPTATYCIMRKMI